VVALAVVLGACHYTPTGPMAREAEVIENVTFDPSLNVDLSQMTKLSEGVYIQDLVVGTGDALVAGAQATADLSLWLHDGTSLGSGTDLSLTISSSSIIPGLALGMIGMMAGGTRRIIIPPSLGYGLYDQTASDGTVLPGGSILIFEVNLTSIN
jgi:FKBP-type peptidyl-prolyl cis-trans isomerase FkpA